GVPPSATRAACRSGWSRSSCSASVRTVSRKQSGMPKPRLAADVADADRFVQDVLAEYGDLTRRNLRAYLPKGEPDSYLYSLVADYPGRGGKMLRPALCLASARAFGASTEDALASAVSIELLHNALLIHDDIEDGSDRRRGTPTLHAKHGVPL